jgi:oligopeptide transport system ATP-binding protein
MYAGKVVELAQRDSIYRRAKHPYTQALLANVLIADPRVQRGRHRTALSGEIPSPLAPQPGCRFHTRCPIAEPRCRQAAPVLGQKAPGHWVACWLR